MVGSIPHCLDTVASHQSFVQHAQDNQEHRALLSAAVSGFAFFFYLDDDNVSFRSLKNVFALHMCMLRVSLAYGHPVETGEGMLDLRFEQASYGGPATDIRYVLQNRHSHSRTRVEGTNIVNLDTFPLFSSSELLLLHHSHPCSI